METCGATPMIRFIILLFIINYTVHANESDFTQVSKFGRNPGDLKMSLYLPDNIKTPVPLVIVLHGCLQDAQDFTSESGWLDYAKKYNFALLSPGQQKANNSANCFNWFLKEDNKKENGELASLYNMLLHTLEHYLVDKGRVFITGFSAGASMTGVMLANYPDFFSAGAVVAGVPYSCANSTIRGLTCMAGFVKKSARKWASYVRDLSSDQVTFPRLSIWTGTSDKIVKASNSDQILKQWLNLHYTSEQEKLSENLTQEKFYTKRTYSRNNKVIIEAYKIKNYPHGQPIAPGNTENNCGNESRYVIDAGVCAAYHQAKFFQLF
jgi:feruloyl esterase